MIEATLELPRAKPTAQERLDEVTRRYERPLTTSKTLTDELTVDEFWRFAVWELFKGLQSRQQDAAWRLQWKRTIQETRQAVGHWSRVWAEIHQSAEPTLRYCVQHPQALRAYGDGLQQLRGIAPQTAHKSMHKINSVFRLAGPPEPGVELYEYGLHLLPVRLRCPCEIPVPPRIPVAYQDSDLGLVWQLCSPARGAEIVGPEIRGIEPWKFWRAYFSVLYYLGLRPAEAGRLQWSEIQADGRIQSEGLNRKQTAPINKAIHPVCLAALDAIRSTRTWVFRWFDRGRWVVEQTINDHARVVLAAAGIPQERRLAAKGLYGFRKKHFTDCERLESGAGTRSLGHGSERIGKLSYHDTRQVDGVLLGLPDLSKGVA
jgi:integrase